MGRLRAAVAAAALSAALAACNPTYAPPVRSIHGGAPARLPVGHAEVGVGLSQYGTGGLFASLPVADDTALELAADTMIDGYSDRCEGWLMGSVGVRQVLLRPDRPGRRSVAADVEMGAGLGVGGADGQDPRDPCRAWSARLAGGLHGGAGAAWVPLRWLSVFGRAHVQVTGAERIPLTFWWAGLVGADFLPGPMSLVLSAGGAGYVNQDDREAGVLVQVGIAGHWRLRGP